jgi:transposase
MVAIPSIKDEDATRPNRERENLVGEQNRIVNRMKAALVRLGIRGFNPKLKRAAGRLDGLHTPGTRSRMTRCGSGVCIAAL